MTCCAGESARATQVRDGESHPKGLVIRGWGLHGAVLLRCLACEMDLAHWNLGPGNEIKKLITQKVEK